jgi:subtilase family serine protease
MGLASGSEFMSHSETIPIVWAGDSHWFSFNFKWPCMGGMTCRAVADSDNAFQEFREDNNEKSINVRIKLI